MIVVNFVVKSLGGHQRDLLPFEPLSHVLPKFLLLWFVVPFRSGGRQERRAKNMHTPSNQSTTTRRPLLT